MIRGARQRTVRAPSRRGPKNDDVDLDQLWMTLSTAIHEIHHKRSSQLSFEQLYRSAYKLVLKNKQDTLYENVSGLEQQWLRDEAKIKVASFISPVLLSYTSSDSSNTTSNERRVAGERFLTALRDEYADHQRSMNMITDVLMYMDKIMRQDQCRPSIYQTAMGLFRHEILQAPCADDSTPRIIHVLQNVLLNMIYMERQGEVIDRSLVRANCQMLEGLYESFKEEESSKLYLTSFEPQFLQASREFYRQEGQRIIANADASTFCAHARQRLKEEEQRCQQTISPISEPKIRKVVEDELISKNIRDIINMEHTGARNMIDNDNVEDLRNVYELISRVDNKKVALKEVISSRVKEIGDAINEAGNVTEPSKPPARQEGEKANADKVVNQQTQSAISWVENVLKEKKKFDNLCEKAFRSDTIIAQALEIAFQDFINRNTRAPEHLSLFLDEYLKRGGNGKTEAEVDAILDGGILLLQYLSEKDLFETYYKKHMSKRLLMKKSVSRDMERQVLSKMKMKLGNQVTQKMEKLLQDMELSESLNSQFKTYVDQLGDPDPKRVEIEVSVCTTTAWPFDNMLRASENDNSTSGECKYPQSVESIRKLYEKFYLNKHNGRKLTWMPNMGSADVRLNLKTPDGKTKKHELNVPTYGMVILMLFNDLPKGQGLSFEEIQAETNIPTNDLIRNLQSLSLVAKWRVLRKESAGKEIGPTDKFFFNDNFSSQYVKIRVTAVTGSSNRIENTDERRETWKKAADERGHAIEAAIVRIMKQRKTLNHTRLMSETLQQLSSRFQPDVNMIKRKIEALIDREYLERGSDPTQATYNYLA